MDSSEFKRRLGADPLSRDPELRAARAENPEREAEARAAEAFEHRLRAALEVPVDAEVIDAAVRHAVESEVGDSRSRRPRRWGALALAASLVIAVGVVLVLRGGGPAPVEEYLQAHYSHDGAEVLARADASAQPFDGRIIERVMGGLRAELAPSLAERVRFIKVCPTPHGKGAHMIVSTDQGPMTLIYMPETRVAESMLLRVDGTEARVVGAGSGAAALIGPGASSERELLALVGESILPLGRKG